MTDNTKLERLSELADMLHSVVEHATVLQNSADLATKRLHNSSNAVEQAAKNLPQSVSASVEKQLTSAATAAAAQMTVSWAEANEAARKATKVYQSAESRLSWKLLTVGCAGLGTIVFAIAGLLIYVTPNIQVLRDERDGLLLHIQQLRDQGADIQMTVCVDGIKKRPCVRIDPNAPEFQNGYRVLSGH